MFDHQTTVGEITALARRGPDSAGLGSAGLGSAGLGSAGVGSAGVGSAGLDEAAMIELLGDLEILKRTAAAAQVRLTAALVAARTRAEATRGVPAARRCQGLGAEIGLARRESPHRGARNLGVAKALATEMPQTLNALAHGEISEWGATVVVRETATLTREHRAQVDAELAGKVARLGERGIAAKARAIGYRLDPASAIRRARGATTDRHITLRPAPDTMTYLTGFLPVANGVACYAALHAHAETQIATGDPRSRGQIMADTLIERLTGQTTGTGTGTDVEIQLVMTEASLLGGDQEPAQVTGYGPIPAPLARRLVRDADHAWIRRLFTDPEHGSLVAMDSQRRTFTGELRHFLVTRDQICRTPWCEAPIRHADHIDPAANGGPTTAENGQGLCQACNQAKQAPGWHTHPIPGHRIPGSRHRTLIHTPTGHTYTSTAPDPPGSPPGTKAPRIYDPPLLISRDSRDLLSA